MLRLQTRIVLRQAITGMENSGSLVLKAAVMGRAQDSATVEWSKNPARDRDDADMASSDGSGQHGDKDHVGDSNRPLDDSHESGSDRAKNRIPFL